MYDEDVSMDQFESDNEEGDEELSRFVTNRTAIKMMIGVRWPKPNPPSPPTPNPFPNSFKKLNVPSTRSFTLSSPN
jgi:hypothetical protein